MNNIQRFIKFRVMPGHDDDIPNTRAGQPLNRFLDDRSVPDPQKPFRAIVKFPGQPGAHACRENHSGADHDRSEKTVCNAAHNRSRSCA